MQQGANFITINKLNYTTICNNSFKLSFMQIGYYLENLRMCSLRVYNGTETRLILDIVYRLYQSCSCNSPTHLLLSFDVSMLGPSFHQYASATRTVNISEENNPVKDEQRNNDTKI